MSSTNTCTTANPGSTPPSTLRRAVSRWIATEVGCDVGDTGCTYDGTVSSPTDNWWLTNLDKDGGETVLIDSHVTLWHYPDGPNSQIPTPTGLDVEAATTQGLAPTLTTIGRKRREPVKVQRCLHKRRPPPTWQTTSIK